MRTYATVSVALAVAAGTWACGGGGDGGGTGPPTTGTVTGQATVGGAGRAGLTLHLRAVAAASDAKPTQSTTAQGAYTFTQVAPGDYRVFVELADTLAADPGPAEDTVVVEAGMSAIVTTFDLRLLVGTVQGLITDTVPAPLAGRTVFLRRFGSSTDRSAATNAGGSYTFPSVTVGEYVVRVQLACGEPHPGTRGVTVSDGMAARVDTIRVTPRSDDLLLTCDIQPIFTSSCALSGCHAGANPEEGMNLSSPSQVQATAIGEPSNQRPSMLRIEPFDSDTSASYLVCKIVPACPARLNLRMPASGAFLSTAEIDSIRTWIDQGAQDVPETN